MSFAARFRQGMKAAIPIWIAFVPSSLAWGIAAQAHGLTLEEIVLMSAWVYSGPAQFAVLVPLAEGKSAATVLIAGLLMNLRFLPMSMALAPFFRGVKRLPLMIASHVVSASSFIVPYLQFQKEREASDGKSVADGYGNLGFFAGIGATAFTVWVVGTAAGYGVGVEFSGGFRRSVEIYPARLFRRAAGGGDERQDHAADLSGEHRHGDSRRAVQSWLGLARDVGADRCLRLECGKMAFTRLELIFILGLSALVLRALPQMFLVGKSFPDMWDRLLRYLSYALLCGLISITLFMSGPRFDTQAAPYRAVALAVTIAIAYKTKSAVTGMLVGTVLVLLFSWLR